MMVKILLRNMFLGISLAAPIGPSGVAVIKNGLKHGFLVALLTGLGVTAGDVTYLLIVYFGLSGFIEIPAVKITIWAFGAMVLLYLGIQSMREPFKEIELDQPETKVNRHPLLVGYAINISNPIAVVWWLGVFGSLLGSSDQSLSRGAILLSSSTILVGILLWHSTVSLLTHWGKRFINERVMRVISVAAGLALIGFGLRFGYSALMALMGGQV